MISPLIRKREEIRRLAKESPYLGERQAAQRMLNKAPPAPKDGLKPWQAEAVSMLKGMGRKVTFEVWSDGSVTATVTSGFAITV